MVHLIDKDALVAEIERRLRELSQLEKASYEIGLYDAYKIVLSFLDNLEVKEVQEEPVDKCKGCNNVKGCITCVDGDQWAHYEEPVSEELLDTTQTITYNGEVYTRCYKDKLDSFACKYPMSVPKTSKRYAKYSDVDLTIAVKEGAKWQKEQMMSKAIRGSVSVNVESNYHSLIYGCWDMDNALINYNEGDKVKVIVIKDE